MDGQNKPLLSLNEQCSIFYNVARSVLTIKILYAPSSGDSMALSSMLLLSPYPCYFVFDSSLYIISVKDLQ